MFVSGFTSILASAAGSPALEVGIIIGGTFILEDAATLLAAMQVAAGAVSLPLALGALYSGIVLGDILLYWLGRWSATHPWAARFVPHQRRDIGRDWVSKRLVRVVLVSRFVPGLRLPTYTTCGFLRAHFPTFALTAVGAALVWTSMLFVVSLKLGRLLLAYLGPYRWVGLAILVAVLVLVGRFATRWQNTRVETSSADSDGREAKDPNADPGTDNPGTDNPGTDNPEAEDPDGKNPDARSETEDRDGKDRDDKDRDGKDRDGKDRDGKDRDGKDRDDKDRDGTEPVADERDGKDRRWPYRWSGLALLAAMLVLVGRLTANWQTPRLETSGTDTAEQGGNRLGAKERVSDERDGKDRR